MMHPIEEKLPEMFAKFGPAFEQRILAAVGKDSAQSVLVRLVFCFVSELKILF
jgi:hypothetical protein